MAWFTSKNEYSRLGVPANSRKWNSSQRSRAAQLAVAVSVVLNLYFILSSWWTWPVPLDNYQELNTFPLVSLDVPPASKENAIVTTLYTDSFAPAVATLGHSLRKTNTSASLIVLYLSDRISEEALCIATSSGFVAQQVSRIPPPRNGKGVHRHFLDQYTKLTLWTLDKIGIKSLIYLDADTLVRKNMDELFLAPWSFAAVPDIYLDSRGFTLGFNAGVMFVRPSSEVFQNMVDQISTAHYRSEDAEQSFLNHYYAAEAVRLPLAYNGNLAIKKRSPELWQGMLPELRLIHYTMVKPFLGHDYAKVDVKDLDKHVEKMTKKRGGYYKREVQWWGEEWKETRETYQQELSLCNVF